MHGRVGGSQSDSVRALLIHMQFGGNLGFHAGPIKHHRILDGNPCILAGMKQKSRRRNRSLSKKRLDSPVSSTYGIMNIDETFTIDIRNRTFSPTSGAPRRGLWPCGSRVANRRRRIPFSHRESTRHYRKNRPNGSISRGHRKLVEVVYRGWLMR